MCVYINIYCTSEIVTSLVWKYVLLDTYKSNNLKYVYMYMYYFFTRAYLKNMCIKVIFLFLLPNIAL